MWSKWIDDGIGVPQVPSSPFLGDGLSTFFREFFDEVHFFMTCVPFVFGNYSEFWFAAVVAIKDGGAFPGSRVSFDRGQLPANAQ